MKLPIVEMIEKFIVFNVNVYDMVVLKMLLYAIGKNTTNEVPNYRVLLEVEQILCVA